MTVLAGPFAVAAVVLLLAGALKAARPTDTANALRALGVPAARPVVRVGGAVEVVIGAAALAFGGRALAALVGASYLAFTGFVAVALVRRIPIASCGCFGKVDTPPSSIHLALDGLAALASLWLAVHAGGAPAVDEVLTDQPLLGLPFLALLALATYLAYLALSVLPKSRAVARRMV